MDPELGLCVAALVPPGARAVRVGAEPPPHGCDCIVVSPEWLQADASVQLRGLLGHLAPNGHVVVAAAARSARVARDPFRRADPFRFSREELTTSLSVAGLDVVFTSLVRDASVEWTPPPLDGSEPAAAMEELGSSHVIVVGRVRASGPAPSCSVILPVRNRADLTRRCLDELCDLPDDVELVVVDDASSDETPALLAAHAGARVVRNTQPRGFAGAANLGARAALGEDLVFLHNDVVPHPGWLDALLGALHDDESNAVAGGRQLYADGSVQQAGVAFGPTLLPYPLFRGSRADAPVLQRRRAVPAVGSAGMAVSRRLFALLGGLDERYRGQLEDVDLCLRVRSRGLRVVYEPGSVLTHDELGTPGPRDSYARDVLYCRAKWSHRIRVDDEDVLGAEGVNAWTSRDAGWHLPRGGRARVVQGAGPAVLWSGLFFDSSGYANDTRNLVLALDRAGVAVYANPFQFTPPTTNLQDAVAARLGELTTRELPQTFVHVAQMAPFLVRSHPSAVWNVARTTFETDRIPPHWAASLDAMDDVWVPTWQNVEAFADSGVSREKLFRLPECFATDAYDPAVEPLRPWGSAGFVFLSVFRFGIRKGWDVLARAFYSAFGREDDVTMVWQVGPSSERDVESNRSQLEGFIRGELGRDPATGPRIVLLNLNLGPDEMPRLYAGADAFVSASRGEGWGRPNMEAMAMGLPTIATASHGPGEYLNADNGYPLAYREVYSPESGWHDRGAPPGRWSEPDASHLRELLRRVVDLPEEARTKGERARRDVLEGYGLEALASAVVARLDERGVAPAARSDVRAVPRVRWEGPHISNFGMAVVNRELSAALVRTDEVELAAAASDAAFTPDVTVRAAWPPDFRRPASGKLVLYQPWEFGSLPRDWIAPLAEAVDEVWAPSGYVHDCYVGSGVDPHRVVVVPYGVDATRFGADGPAMVLPTRKRFRFLFAGGAIPRKGVDLLLESYRSAFRATDDVCLVIKEHGGSSFYADQSLAPRIRAFQAADGCGEIVHIEDDLEDLAPLYRACDVFVLPYRGEGFGLTIAEAMACGLPAIVPDRGAALDYCDESVAYLVPSSAVPVGPGRVGPYETVDEPFWAEVDVGALARVMREAYEDAAGASARGRRASERIHDGWTWERSADTALRRIVALSADGERVRTISACIIVRDEEDALPGCLASLEGAVDQVVVVDTGSGDSTVEIARASGALTFHCAWTGDFAAARNESLRHATGDWVLVIDADQRLDAGSRDELRRLTSTDRRAVYLVRQLNYRADPSSLEEHLAARVFPNDPDIRFQGRVHEQAVSLRGDDLPNVATGVILHHYGYTDAVRNSAKAERDRVALEDAVRDDPSDAFAAHMLGAVYLALGMDEEAEAELLRALDLVERRPPPVPQYVARSHCLLAGVHLARARPATALAHAAAALADVPDYADAHLAAGLALSALGRFEEALDAYQRARASTHAPAFAPTDRSAGGWRALLGMAEAYEALGRSGQAAACRTQAAELKAGLVRAG